MLSHLWNPFLSFISIEKRINIFWISGFFLPVINATVFRIWNYGILSVLNHNSKKNLSKIPLPDSIKINYPVPTDIYLVKIRRQFGNLLIHTCLGSLELRVDPGQAWPSNIGSLLNFCSSNSLSWAPDSRASSLQRHKAVRVFSLHFLLLL